MRIILPSDCNACLRALNPNRLVVSKPRVSHSRVHTPWWGPLMLSIVDTWGCIQYFFESCFAIVTTSFYLVSLTKMHWHLVPQEIKKVTLELWCTGIQHQTGKAIFFPRSFFAKLLDDSLIDSLRWCIYTPPVSTKHFSLKEQVLC